MKHFIRLGLVVLTLVVAVAGSVVILYAASDHGGGENHGGGGNHGSQQGRARFGGEVTEVTSDTVTVSGYGNSGGHGPIHPRHSISDSHALTDTHSITTSAAFTRVAYFTDTTAVRLVECQCDGTLADITVGDHIDARGVRMSDGSYIALTITIAPDGDKLGGRVTAVDGMTLSVHSRGNLSGTIIANASTRYLTRDGEATLADVTVDKKIAAYGTAQEDGSLLARVVLIQGGKPMTSSASSVGASAVDSVAAVAETITVDSAAIDALVNNLASDDDQPLEVNLVQTVYLPMVRR